MLQEAAVDVVVEADVEVVVVTTTRLHLKSRQLAQSLRPSLLQLTMQSPS